MTSPRVPAIVSATILAALLAASPANAAPPENADPALAPWFQSLRQPETGMSCCDIADCRPTEYRTVGDLLDEATRHHVLRARYRSLTIAEAAVTSSA